MYITVTMKEVDELVECGVFAVQGTGCPAPGLFHLCPVHPRHQGKVPDQLVMADCDNLETPWPAPAGADFVGTTMRGYTPETKGIDDIDFDFCP